MTTDDRDKLIARAQGGDVVAFEALVTDHLPMVHRFARAFASLPSDAEDLAQDALLRVFRSLRAFRYQAAFSTWLYAVVRSAYLDAIKARASKGRALEEPVRRAHLQAEGGSRPDADLERQEERERLWGALRQLPAEFRVAVVLFDLEGCAYDEVAAIEGVAVGTVKSRLHRGRAQLKKLLCAPRGNVLPARRATAEDPSRPGTLEASASSHHTRGS